MNFTGITLGTGRWVGRSSQILAGNQVFLDDAPAD